MMNQKDNKEVIIGVTANIRTDEKLSIKEEVMEGFLRQNGEIYKAIYKCTYRLIEEFSLWDDKIGMINVRLLAEKNGIQIQDQLMQSEKPIISDEILGYYNGFYLNSTDKEIYVNSNLSEVFKRYVIAHELAHYFMKIENVTKGYCMNMIFPVNGMERLCDLFSAFLLMPFEKVLVLWEKFRKENESTGGALPDTYSWLKYLAFNFGVTEYHAAIMYYDIRALGGILYELYYDENELSVREEDWMPNIEKYEEFFKGMKNAE